METVKVRDGWLLGRASPVPGHWCHVSWSGQLCNIILSNHCKGGGAVLYKCTVITGRWP